MAGIARINFLKWTAVGAALLLAAFLGAYLGRSLFDRPPRPSTEKHHDHAHTADLAGQDAWYSCAMHPWIRQKEPGNCPICGMKLVKESGPGGSMRTLTISSEAARLMQIEVSPVERRFVEARIRMVGEVTYDETRLKRITAWVDGRLDRLFVDFTGIPVKEGDHMVLIYSPELYSAQSELLQAIKLQAKPGSPDEVDLVAAAREKLRLLGMTPKQIKEIEARGKPSYHLTINAPIGGIVIRKFKNQGDYVKTGDKIYTIADLSHLWVMLDAYESDLEWIRYGQKVSFTTEAFPGEHFDGRIAFIDPVLDEKTRTVKVRVNVPNPDGKLKPEMFVHGEVRSMVAAGGRVMDPELAGKWISPMHPEIVRDKPGKCPICGMPLVRAESLGYVAAEAKQENKPLVIPVSAPLITGKRAIVYVQTAVEPMPVFEGREIVLGPRAGDYYLVRAGLREGELVVTRGNFKLDADIQIQAKPSMMTPEGGSGMAGHHHGGPTPAKGKKQPMRMHIPEPFKTQVAALAVVIERIATAVDKDDLRAAREEFTHLEKALSFVNAYLLKGHARMLWDELHMLLRNDVVVGRDAKKIAEARRALGSIRQHWQRVTREILSTRDLTIATSVPETFKTGLREIWRAYVPLQRALAGDNAKAAAAAAARLRKTVAALEADDLPTAARNFWGKEKRHLLEGTTAIEKARDIQKMREAFSTVSEALTSLIEIFGLPSGERVYLLRCPMAFNNLGARWLQPEPQPRNPYFGAEMPACAETPRKLAGPSTSD